MSSSFAGRNITSILPSSSATSSHLPTDRWAETANIRNMNVVGYVSYALSVMQPRNSVCITAVSNDTLSPREHNQRVQNKIENHCLSLGAHIQIANLQTTTFV